ncbi:MAG: glycosyltransferase [Elusimicrobiota bacterium]|jgi:trehalose synthase|nr:glycosyltransferase [Elusimicrobiota bacterium]
MGNLENLQKASGVGVWDLKEAYKAAGNLRLNIITAGRYGSGVSEIFSRANEYFNELGLFSNWENIIAGEEFFNLAKKITNAVTLGSEVSLKELRRFEQLSYELNIDTNYDAVYINDHAPLIAAQMSAAQKIFRAHLDMSRANDLAWDFLKPFIESCEHIIFTDPSFHKPLKGDIRYITPTIDPGSPKNHFVPRQDALKVLKEYKIPADKPIITQVGRFDAMKDPLGVIDAFNLVRQERPCTLILAGGHAQDDPQSQQVYQEALEKAAGSKDIFLLAINRQDYKIAALQSVSDVILQKSIAESFGLAITEALWKEKPVVASNIGGIPLQIKDGKTGLLCHDIESCANALLRLLEDKALGVKLGKNGHSLVREKFLITSELWQHLPVFKSIMEI